jgi:hypothetical protein
MKRVECDQCKNFEPVVMEDENLIGKIYSKAKCKLGKRVMFRIPDMSTPGYPFNTGGWIRHCDEFEGKENMSADLQL